MKFMLTRIKISPRKVCCVKQKVLLVLYVIAAVDMPAFNAFEIFQDDET
jgi:hypothetical protein